jgi:CHASE3 domain sensor protein
MKNNMEDKSQVRRIDTMSNNKRELNEEYTKTMGKMEREEYTKIMEEMEREEARHIIARAGLVVLFFGFIAVLAAMGAAQGVMAFWPLYGFTILGILVMILIAYLIHWCLENF